MVETVHIDEFLKNTLGGEIVIPKLKSYKVTDLAKAVDQNCKIRIIGGSVISGFTYESITWIKIN